MFPWLLVPIRWKLCQTLKKRGLTTENLYHKSNQTKQNTTSGICPSKIKFKKCNNNRKKKGLWKQKLYSKLENARATNLFTNGWFGEWLLVSKKVTGLDENHWEFTTSTVCKNIVKKVCDCSSSKSSWTLNVLYQLKPKSFNSFQQQNSMVHAN